MADVAEQAAELELPASPASLASSMRSSSSVKRQKAEANLEMARRLMAIEEADAQERLDRQRRLLQLELEARHAQIDSTSSSRSRRSSRPASSAPTQHLRPLLASSTTRSAASLISSGQENKVEVSSSQPRLETVCKLPGKSALTATRHWVETQKPVTAHATFAAGTTATKPAKESPEAGGLHPAQAAYGMQKFLIRQTVGRDLPAFSGDSEEWPIFASTHQRTSDECGFSPSENVIRLQRCLKGPAKAAVGAMLTVPENLPTVLQVLESRFGRPDAVIAAMIGKAKAIGQVKPGDFDSLINLSTAVTTLVTTMEHLRSEGHMYNPQLRQELVGRLPTSLRLQWGEVLVRQGSHDISLRVFSLWLADKAEAAVRVVDLPGTRTDKTQRVYSHQEVSTVHSTAAAMAPASATSKTQSACLCCKQVQHALSKCSTFTKLGQKARFELVKRHRLCFSCLASGHATRKCGSRKQCSEPDCKYHHHVLLHKGKAAEKPVDTCGHTGIPGATRVLLRVLPVTVSGPKGCVETLALLDEASTVTLMDKALADDIGAVGQSDPLHMAWTNSTTHTDNSSCRVSVLVNGSDGTQHQMDDVRTAKDLKLHSQSIDGRGLANRWPHLDDSRGASYPAVQPRMLIGQDNGHLTVAREVVEGPPNAPMLTRTLLGWVVHGRIGARTHQDQLEPEAIYHIWQPESDLHQLVKESFTIENFGVVPSASAGKPKAMIRAESILNDTTVRVGDRYETGLLWKSDQPKLPSSQDMAFNRLMGIERKMAKSPEFAAEYAQKIDEYVQKGYARKLTPAEAAEQTAHTWYLPHFAVFNPNKPGKLRFVFDAAAKARGMSLNDALLPGPDLLNQLVGVLMKFRQRAIAFAADIKEMFHQVRIRLEDQPAQRFLWRQPGETGPPDTYVMEVMIFGAVSSPCSAQFTMRRNAEEHREEFAAVAAACEENYYMDDYLDSVDTTDQAVQRVADTIEIQQRGGFTIRNWISNCSEVMMSVPADMRTAGVVDLSSQLPVERMLGLRWDPNSDQFLFQLNVTRREQLSAAHPTKRSLLSIVMSVFDPLGFLAAFVIAARILLQDIWLSGIGWDDEIPPELLSRWQIWCGQLLEISKFRISRAYSCFTSSATDLSLHVFCDASSKAFAAVAYLRVEHADDVECTLVAAKTRVAPLKPTSIPRLELQAAVLGCRLAQMLAQEHGLKWHSTCFWSASRTVLQWIKSDARQFKPFVAHRVAEICDASEASSWHWVPTLLNVADDASRGISMHELSCGRWKSGPEFLMQSREAWPAAPATSDECIDTTEVKKEFVAATTSPPRPQQIAEALPDVNRFSSWKRLICTTAYVARFIANTRARVRGQTVGSTAAISAKEMDAAEQLWMQSVQAECFAEEVALLSDGQPVSTSSRLRQLAPAIDEDGILRVQGRLTHATEMAYSAKHPAILCPKHRYTQLLVHEYHLRSGHHGHERTLNELRQQYWVTTGRAAVKRAWSECQYCKNQRANPKPPVMGNLPVQRLTPFLRPFTFTGLDYFGPLHIKIGRRRELRYGALFTCLSTRAVHLEVAHSLMAIRRMCARRGCPQEIHSDNGTNFRGADRELKAALEDFRQDRLAAECSSKGISWHFNPPLAPHMGGSWERLVRAVKIAMKSVMKERVVTEEVLATVFAEAEQLVNSRPLTHVSVDPDDEESLTPNHFLIGSSSATGRPGVFVDADLSLRKHWRIAQKITDEFWKRWILEYRPELTRRRKWQDGTPSLAVGDVVVIVDSNQPRGQWPRGRLEAVHPGSDGVVRVADVRTKSGLYRRSVVKLAKLDVLR
ncbi:uncharacterized protein LOC135808982 [Sycon ciliatum]|uniref:uncharacterized protein LOC135808982 n=1 Tax=Sycon ciliatum TaxID=27933 RepID=UPI0031F62978